MGNEVRYSKGLANHLLTNFTADERREIRRLFGLIKIDPYMDGLHKIDYQVPPVVYTLYIGSPHFRIFYYMVGNVIRIAFVERAVGEPMVR